MLKKKMMNEDVTESILFAGTLSFAQPGNLILGLGFFNPLIHLNPE